ncbi:hypothetical protein OKW96_16615 [Sphingobacterium sp. KU25419]|nr:hypothetical protein OKW96_16615 [Sphingobacterium sp. KU25419]
MKNDVARQAHKAKIKSTIDFVLASKRPKALSEFEEILQRSSIKWCCGRMSKDLFTV